MTRQDGFEAWFTASREEVASLFDEMADGIEDGHVEWGTVAVDLPETVDVELECEPEDDGYEFELTMNWRPTEEGLGEPTVESTADTEEATADDDADAASDTSAETATDEQADDTTETSPPDSGVTISADDESASVETEGEGVDTDQDADKEAHAAEDQAETGGEAEADEEHTVPLESGETTDD